MSSILFAYASAAEEKSVDFVIGWFRDAGVRAARYKVIRDGNHYRIHWRLVNEANERVAGNAVFNGGEAVENIKLMERTLIGLVRGREGLWVLDVHHGCLILQGSVSWKDKERTKVVKKLYPDYRWTTWDLPEGKYEFSRILFEEEESPLPDSV